MAAPGCNAVKFAHVFPLLEVKELVPCERAGFSKTADLHLHVRVSTRALTKIEHGQFFLCCDGIFGIRAGCRPRAGGLQAGNHVDTPLSSSSAGCFPPPLDKIRLSDMLIDVSAQESSERPRAPRLFVFYQSPRASER